MRKKKPNGERLRLYVQAAISFILLAAGFYTVFTTDWNNNPQIVAAATGWIGLVAGYWLR